jgi:hypothetical protein
LRQVPAGLPELRLTPLTLRGNASSFELKARADVPYVELRLIWLKTEQYQSYQAVVRRIRDGEAYTISDLQAQRILRTTSASSSRRTSSPAAPTKYS